LLAAAALAAALGEADAGVVGDSLGVTLG